MKYVGLLVAFIFLSINSYGGAPLCSLDQAQRQAEGWLKIQYKTSSVIRSGGMGVAPWTNHLPSKYTFHFSAVPKDPKYATCCSMIGEISIAVRADMSCAPVPTGMASTAAVVETRDSYSFQDFLKDTQAP